MRNTQINVFYDQYAFAIYLDKMEKRIALQSLLCKCKNIDRLYKTKTVVLTKDHNIFLISGVRKRLFSSIAGYVLIEA